MAGRVPFSSGVRTVVKAQKAQLQQGASWGQSVNFASIDMGNQDESSFTIQPFQCWNATVNGVARAPWHGEHEAFNHDFWVLSMVFPMQVPLPATLQIRMIPKNP